MNVIITYINNTSYGEMMKLIQTGERVKGDVISKTGTRMLSQATQSLLNTSNKIAQSVQETANNEFEDQFNIAAKEAEEQAGIDARDAVENGYTFDEQSENTIYAQQYNKTAEVTALANIEATIVSESKELATKYYNNAQGYQDALNEKVEKFVVGNSLNAKQKGLVNGMVVAENKKYLGSIMAKSLIEEKNKESTAVLNTIQQTANVAQQNLFDGDVEAYKEQTAKLENMTEAAMLNNNISPAQRVQMQNDYIKSSNIQEISGKVERGVQQMYSDTSFTYEEQASYINAGNQAIDAWVESSEKGGLYTPEELNQEEAKLRKQLQLANNDLYKRANKGSQDAVDNSIVLNSDKLDYKNKDEVKAINSFTAQALTDANGNIDYDINNLDTRKFAMEITQAKGIIPTEILSSIRKNSKSTDPMRVISSVDMLMQLQEKAPEVLDQFSESEVIFATKVKNQMELGMTAEDSINSAREYFRGGDVKAKEEFAIGEATNDGTVKAYNKEVSKSFNSFSEDAFDGSGIGGWIKGVFTDADDNSQAKYDYAKLHKHYLVQSGDYDTATELTNKAIKRSYGVSHLQGESGVMKFSPELVMNGNNDESEWLTESWETKKEATVKFLKERGVNVKPEDVSFEAGVDTYNGEKTWTLFYTDTSGIKQRVAQSVTDGYWTPNYYDTEVGAKDKEFQAEAKKEAAIEMAKNKVIFKDNIRIKKFKSSGKKAQQLQEVSKRNKEEDEADLQERLTDYEDKDFKLNQL